MSLRQPDRAEPLAALPPSVPGLCPAARRRYLLVAAILASALGFIDGTVVSIALPAMRESLGATLSATQWFHNAYLLTLSALILAGGSLADRFGTARTFGWGIAVFMAASLACAAAPTPGTLIAARAAQGVGAAFMIPGSLALIARTYPEEERGRAIGIWAAASAITTAGGPLLGGALLTAGGPEVWRWLFAVNLPLGAVAIWLLARNVEADHVEDAKAPLDIAGAAAATLALGLFAYGLSLAQPGDGHAATASPWPSLIASVAVFVLFVVIEWRSPAPMLPLSLFARADFSAANLATLALYAALSGVAFFLPMTLIAGWGLAPIAASVVFLPLTIFVGLFSSRVGQLADTIGARPLIAGGSLLVGVALMLMAAAAPAEAFWLGILPGAIVMGAGMCLVVTPLSTAVMAAVPATQTGAASGVNNAVSRISGLIAVAALGPVAAAAYFAADGPESFGTQSALPEHAAAMSAAFASIALICALTAFAAAAAAWFGLPARQR
ncbi:MAG: MFS transporter [Pseudomonadota bacterium]